MQINSQTAQKGRGASKIFLFSVVGVVVLLAVAFGAWRYYGGGSTNQSGKVVETSDNKGGALVSSAILPQDVQEAARRITRELEILRVLKELDTKFFKDPRLDTFVQTPVDIPSASPVARDFALTPISRPQISPTPQPKPRGL